MLSGFLLTKFSCSLGVLMVADRLEGMKRWSFVLAMPLEWAWLARKPEMGLGRFGRVLAGLGSERGGRRKVWLVRLRPPHGGVGAGEECGWLCGDLQRCEEKRVQEVECWVRRG